MKIKIKINEKWKVVFVAFAEKIIYNNVDNVIEWHITNNETLKWPRQIEK